MRIDSANRVGPNDEARDQPRPCSTMAKRMKAKTAITGLTLVAVAMMIGVWVRIHSKPSIIFLGARQERGRSVWTFRINNAGSSTFSFLGNGPAQPGYVCRMLSPSGRRILLYSPNMNISAIGSVPAMFSLRPHSSLDFRVDPAEVQGYGGDPPLGVPFVVGIYLERGTPDECLRRCRQGTFERVRLRVLCWLSVVLHRSVGEFYWTWSEPARVGLSVQEIEPMSGRPIRLVLYLSPCSALPLTAGPHRSMRE